MLRRSNIISITVVFIAFFLLCLALTACVPSLETDSSNALSLETGSSNLEELRGIDPKVEQNIAKIDSESDDRTNVFIDAEEESQNPSAVEEKQNNIDVAALPVATSASQIITVSVADDGTSTLAMYSRLDDGNWFKSISDTLAYIGQEGIGEAYEDVPITPQGTFPLVSAFGIASNPGAALPYTQVDDSMYWVSDSESAYYNRLVSESDADDFDKDISEHLVSCWPDYEYAIVMGYNVDCTPYMGSAFFIHCKGDDDFTQGCVAVDRETMKQLVQNVGANAVIVIDYESNFPYV